MSDKQTANIRIGMTRDRWQSLMSDHTTSLTRDELKLGWHWCTNWDDMLVGPGMEEMKSCSCEAPHVEKARSQ